MLCVFVQKKKDLKSFLLFSVWISCTPLSLSSASPSTMFPTWWCGSTPSPPENTSPPTWRFVSPSKQSFWGLAGVFQTVFDRAAPRLCRSIVGMTMYNQATQEIAKPSELLTSVRAYMTVLQSIENYVTIDITRVFNNVLLQQTQHLDSHGEPTITSLYTNWCVPLSVCRSLGKSPRTVWSRK